jgi:hypothetical protein
MAERRNHLAAQGARPLLRAGTATAAVLVITSRLAVPVFTRRTQRVDGDQSLCAAGGLGQCGGHDQYTPLMTASPPNVSTGLTSLTESPS